MFPISAWSLGELNRIIFSFFWKGKKDLVARAVVIQPRSHGGFGLISAHLKSRALLLQWIRRFRVSSHGWRLFFAYFGLNSFFVPLPQKSSLFLFVLILNVSLRFMLPFWMFGVLWMATHLRTSPIYLLEAPQPQSCYDLLLGANRRSPHCKRKFLPTFGHLYWPAMWKRVHFFPWTAR